MNDKLEKYNYPNFLKGNEFEFDIKEVLKDSVYYPGSGTDGTLVKQFRGNFFSFVHVDYGLTKGQLDEALIEYPFRGFKIIHRESLDPHVLVPTAFESIHFNSFFEGMIPFVEWLVFENEVKERFSLLHICAEGVESYRDLYIRNEINAEAIAIISTDSFSGNWTSFSNKPHLKREVLRSRLDKPKYLFCYNQHHNWHEYSKKIDDFYSTRDFLVTIYELE